MASHSVDPVPDEGLERRGSRGRLSVDERETLRELALESIRFGLEKGRPLDPELDSATPALQQQGAAFVTLTIQGQLRGCVGSFEAQRPLMKDVAQNAYSAAFMDFRFSPLTAGEIVELELHISLLTPLEPMEVEDRSDLLRRLRPGTDGLLVEDTSHRAIFLPQVWDSLEDPEDFLGELFLKAGLSRNHWSETLRIYRYAVEEF